MAINPTLNQYAAGGVAKAVADAVGVTTPNQYNATGGFWGQLYTAAGMSGSAISQYYASGGALGQLIGVGTHTAPTITNADTSIELLESTAEEGDTIVTVTATDPEHNAITFSLSEDEEGLFVIHATTGVVTSTDDLLEADSPFAFTVVATDSGGSTDTQEFTVAVTADP